MSESIFELIPLNKISPSSTNPRKRFPQDRLEELAQSIRVQGVLQPILVRPTKAFGTEGDAPKYELVAGERRWRAAQLAGIEEIPVIVRQITDIEVVEIQLIENEQREDVHPFEEAIAYANLIKLGAYDAAKLGEKIGKSERHIQTRLQLLQLCDEVVEWFYRDQLATGHCLLLTRFDAQGQRHWANLAITGEWSTRQLALALSAAEQAKKPTLPAFDKVYRKALLAAVSKVCNDNSRLEEFLKSHGVDPSDIKANIDKQFAEIQPVAPEPQPKAEKKKAKAPKSEAGGEREPVPQAQQEPEPYPVDDGSVPSRPSAIEPPSPSDDPPASEPTQALALSPLFTVERIPADRKRSGVLYDRFDFIRMKDGATATQFLRAEFVPDEDSPEYVKVAKETFDKITAWEKPSEEPAPTEGPAVAELSGPAPLNGPEKIEAARAAR